MNKSDELLTARLDRQDEFYFGLSDTLDVKASLALIVVVFLADQSGDILSSPNLPSGLFWLQLIACCGQVLSGVLALAAMWPRDHQCENVAGLEEWTKELQALHNSNDETVLSELVNGIRLRTRERVGVNQSNCRVKSRLVHSAFLFSAASLGLNLLSLLLHARA